MAIRPSPSPMQDLVDDNKKINPAWFKWLDYFRQAASSSAGQSSIQFQDEGSNLGASGGITNLNVAGSAITATISGTTVTVTSDQMAFSDILAFAAAN